MSGVVLRCPTCGTTQSHPGECEACSEDEVRYFCANHSPGLWLVETRCGDCGATFGAAPTEHAEPTTRATPPTRTRLGPRIESRPPMPRAAERSRPAPEPPRDGVDEADGAAVPSLAEVLVDMLEESKRAGGAVEDVPWREPSSPAPRSPLPIMGCLGRLVLLVLLLIVLGLAALSSLFT